MSQALSSRVKGHTTSLKGFRLLSQGGILFKKHCKPPDTSGAIQVPSTTSDSMKTSRGPRETQALLQHSWRPGEISERLLLPHLFHCCPFMSSPGRKGMQQGRGQSPTVEYIMSMSTWKGKFYFPTNWKHETHHSLSTTLALYISLYREKNM